MLKHHLPFFEIKAYCTIINLLKINQKYSFLHNTNLKIMTLLTKSILIKVHYYK
jgi:hypothetical protein